MAYLMGIDLGTSSLKTLLADSKGHKVALAAKDYQFASPRQGYAEHDPEEWWQACVETVREVIEKSGVSPDEIAGVSFSGQMHGAVLLDENYEPIRPAILHCDARSGVQVKAVKEMLGEEVKSLMMNPVYSGFLFISLLWVKENEPENYAKIRHVMLPKDYLRFKLCKEIASDYSDASATLAFDIENGCWSKEILSRFDIPMEWFPPVFNTADKVGNICSEASIETGLSEKTAVGAGGGDQVMQSIGNGVIRPGQAIANIGTSGQVSFQSAKPIKNPARSTNTFCSYEKGRWLTMGAIMNAGLCLKWWRSITGETDYEKLNADVAAVAPGSGGVIFLPYLNGERTPHLDPDLSGSFIGVNLGTDRAKMTRAVMEGVTYALNQCIELCGEMGLHCDNAIVASGGGARSLPWLQIQADVFGLPVKVAESEEQACLGAVIAAGVASGVYKDLEEGCAMAVRYRDLVVNPDPERHKIYESYYELYKEIFASGGDVFHRLTLLGRL